MIRRVQFLRTFYQDGRPKYLAGRDYPFNDETRSQALAGAAQLITINAGPLRLIAHLVQCAAAGYYLACERGETTKAELHGR